MRYVSCPVSLKKAVTLHQFTFTKSNYNYRSLSTQLNNHYTLYIFRTRLELWPMLGIVPFRAGPRRNYTLISYPGKKNSIHGLVINMKHALKEFPIHHQKYIELKTKGAILMGDVDERKEMVGEGCFNEFNNSLDQVVRAKPLYRSTNTDEIISTLNTIDNYHLGVLVLPNFSYKLINFCF